MTEIFIACNSQHYNQMIITMRCDILTEISTKEKDSLTDNSIDKAFKLFIENIDILSIILKGLIEDFNNIDLETVKTLIPKNKDGDKALIRNTEIVSTHGNTIILDSLFDIPLSNTESVQIVVNIEGQGRPNVGYDLNSRALYYASRLISEQKLSNDGGRYDSLKKGLQYLADNET